MFNRPSHYTERFIDLRFKNALNIIQNLTGESSFHLLKNEKLEVKSNKREDPATMIDYFSVVCTLQTSNRRRYQHTKTRFI
jgi:hypothetical protein